MNELLRFFLRHNFIILFLVLESLGILFLVQNNKYHKAKFINFTHKISGIVYNKTSSIRDYTSLREENRKLIEENNRLYNHLRETYRINNFSNEIYTDTTLQKQYVYISARVINNSTDKQYNYITLNKGKKDGLEKEMGVICGDGIVGIVKEVSENFASVISLLNRNLKLNAKIKSSGYFGPLQWNGKGYRKAILSDIPHHVSIRIGDTIITSGYSAIFPEGIVVGTIADKKLKGGNYYEVSVNLSTDFKNLRNVQVIKNYYLKEQLKLEKSGAND